MLTNKAGKILSAFEATEIEILNTNGVGGISKLLDGTLRVILHTDTPEVRESVLQVIGNKLPENRVIFESNKPTDHCLFCGKTWGEITVLITSNLPLTQGKTSLSCICFQCVEDFAAQISTKEPKNDT